MAGGVSRALRQLTRPFRVLAIETSCDDTAVSIVDSSRRILAETARHQHALHAPTEGIVPSLAAASHRRALPSTIRQVLTTAQLAMQDVDAVAVTRGPGIASCLTVGFDAARVLAAAHQLPLYPIHHLEGHILMTRMEGEGPDAVPFPFLALVISGGHTALLLARAVGDYQQLGSTLDDSVGEAVDKAARSLGLGYDPGTGPAAVFVEAALRGHHDPAIQLPTLRSRHMAQGLDFSFSGIKTAFASACAARKAPDGTLSSEDQQNLAWAFLQHCSHQLIDRVQRTLPLLRSEGGFAEGGAPVPLVVCGGATRNKFIFARYGSQLGHRWLLNNTTRLAHTLEGPFRIFRCAPQHCVDNAVMIGWTAIEHILAGREPMRLDSVRPDWPLADLKLDLEGTESNARDDVRIAN